MILVRDLSGLLALDLKGGDSLTVRRVTSFLTVRRGVSYELVHGTTTTRLEFANEKTADRELARLATQLRRVHKRGETKAVTVHPLAVLVAVAVIGVAALNPTFVGSHAGGTALSPPMTMPPFGDMDGPANAATARPPVAFAPVAHPVSLTDPATSAPAAPRPPAIPATAAGAAPQAAASAEAAEQERTLAQIKRIQDAVSAGQVITDDMLKGLPPALERQAKAALHVAAARAAQEDDRVSAELSNDAAGTPAAATPAPATESQPPAAVPVAAPVVAPSARAAAKPPVPAALQERINDEGVDNIPPRADWDLPLLLPPVPGGGKGIGAPEDLESFGIKLSHP